ncbi:hypothetical protein HZA41_03510, partial [Candidatus Peregrinibacteria bacterium]|nr:hypothetical protein [Candidatus Peregrinibacteria bacterium]
MDYRQVIKESWEFTQENKRLIFWYGFVPSLLTTLVSVLFFTYQIIATYKSITVSEGEHTSFLREVIEALYIFIKTHPTQGIIFIIAVLVILFFYLVIPTLCQGARIQLISRQLNGQKTRIRDGLIYGMFSFLPLFEYHVAIKTFSIVAILTEAGFTLRNLGMGWFKALIIPFLFFALVGLVLSLIFTYTEYFIVIDKTPTFRSIIASCRLVLYHWQETFLILLLMFLITLRIIFNILLVFIIPALVIIPAGYLATKTLATIGVIIGIILGLVSLSFAAYFSGILEVFTSTVWVKTFL